MTIVEKIRDILIDDTSVSAVVSSRVYPVRVPDRVSYPCISLRRSGGAPEPTLAGVESTSSIDIEVVGIAKTYAAAVALGDKIKTALNAYRGADTDDPLVESCLLKSESDDSLDPSDGSSEVYYGVVQEYGVMYSVRG